MPGPGDNERFMPSFPACVKWVSGFQNPGICRPIINGLRATSSKFYVLEVKSPAAQMGMVTNRMKYFCHLESKALVVKRR